MDGPSHYLEAERLLEAARISTDHNYDGQGAVPTLLATLVHATLANAVATATGSRSPLTAAGRSAASQRSLGQYHRPF